MALRSSEATSMRLPERRSAGGEPAAARQQTGDVNCSKAAAAATAAATVSRGDRTKSANRPTLAKLRRLLAPVNSLAAIRLKLLLFGALAVLAASVSAPVHAGFFTFYFPNIFKPKGFGELSDMIKSLEGQMNEVKDKFQDVQYFWGQLERLDGIQRQQQEVEGEETPAGPTPTATLAPTLQPVEDYPEESACSDVFPLFRELAINYAHTDFQFYLKPLELYHEHLVEVRAKWYPAGLESKAALPREWEQELMERELRLKIEWLRRLIEEREYREQRARMLDIWKSVRRGLDSSVACLYLRYAYRQIAEDINQVALEANLEGMQAAMELLRRAYKRIDKFKESDAKIRQDIEEEIKKVERFTIRA